MIYHPMLGNIYGGQPQGSPFVPMPSPARPAGLGGPVAPLPSPARPAGLGGPAAPMPSPARPVDPMPSPARPADLGAPELTAGQRFQQTMNNPLVAAALGAGTSILGTRGQGDRGALQAGLGGGMAGALGAIQKREAATKEEERQQRMRQLLGEFGNLADLFGPDGQAAQAINGSVYNPADQRLTGYAGIGP